MNLDSRLLSVVLRGELHRWAWWEEETWRLECPGGTSSLIDEMLEKSIG